MWTLCCHTINQSKNVNAIVLYCNYYTGYNNYSCLLLIFTVYFFQYFTKWNLESFQNYYGCYLRRERAKLKYYFYLKYLQVLLSSTDSKSERENDKTRHRFANCCWSRMLINFLMFTERKKKSVRISQSEKHNH